MEISAAGGERLTLGRLRLPGGDWLVLEEVHEKLCVGLGWHTVRDTAGEGARTPRLAPCCAACLSRDCFLGKLNRCRKARAHCMHACQMRG